VLREGDRRGVAVEINTHGLRNWYGPGVRPRPDCWNSTGTWAAVRDVGSDAHREQYVGAGIAQASLWPTGLGFNADSILCKPKSVCLRRQYEGSRRRAG
jgi:hypothetical protein